MQSRLRTTLRSMSFGLMLCAVFFALPGVISIPFLTFVLWISPCIWVPGVIYARGKQRAFFLGALVGGAAPFMVATVFAISFVLQFWRGLHRSDALLRFFDSEIATATCVILIVPTLFSFVGGFVSVYVRSMVQPGMRSLPAVDANLYRQHPLGPVQVPE
jgi:hypothetical protein